MCIYCASNYTNIHFQFYQLPGKFLKDKKTSFEDFSIVLSWGLRLICQGGFACNNKMLLANKIKESEEYIENKSLGFKTFLESLRESRPNPPFQRRPSQSIHQSEPLPENEHPSEANRSEILHFDRSEHGLERPVNNLSSGAVAAVTQGDKTIKNKLRVGVANRQRANCFRLPAYCFQPTKQELGSHLKEVKKDMPKIVMEVTRRGQVQRQEEFEQQMEYNDLKGGQKPKRISALNPHLVLKYCSIHQIGSASSLKEILVFFTRLMELLNFSLPEPKIEKYRNCVYFGQPIRKNQIYEGIVYYYSGVVYFGELLNSQRQGVGVEIDLNKGSIHKGQFKDGEMVGYFHVKKDDQRYFGEVSQGKYHGRGRLINREEVFQGEFKSGKKAYGSSQKQKYANPKELSTSRANRRQTPYWSGEKQLNSSRTQRFEFSNNKIRPINNINRGSYMQFDSSPEKKKTSRRYAEQTREFSYPLNYQMEGTFNPQISEMINSKKASRVASMRIREVGKLHSTRLPQPEQEQERPLMNKF